MCLVTSCTAAAIGPSGFCAEHWHRIDVVYRVALWRARAAREVLAGKVRPETIYAIEQFACADIEGHSVIPEAEERELIHLALGRLFRERAILSGSSDPLTFFEAPPEPILWELATNA